ncbi:MAG: thioredoxin-disulfide reductase [Ruminococcus sp.]|jgi:thioredoxin reductase (NADPH)
MSTVVYDVIIVGSGPAGLAAAVYGQRAGLSLMVLEEAYVSGGQVLNTYDVDNYPGLPGISGMELAEKFYEHAKSMGAVFQTASVKSIGEENGLKVIQTSKDKLLARTVILATGAHHRLLGVPGEETLTGMGVSYCATCDGAFFRDKTVAVIGGGDVAVEDAIFLSRGCKKVYVIHRRDELRAARILQNKLLSLENVEMKWSCVADEILGENQVTGLKVHSVKNQEISELAVDGVFIAVGIVPNTGFLGDTVELDKSGYIVAGEDTRTSVPGIFAAGDVRTKALRQIITAAADGANAITSVEEYLLNH